MKFIFFLRASLVIALSLGGISCSLTSEKMAQDAVDSTHDKFDHTKILINILSDQIINQYNIQKIIRLTTSFIETDIPKALSALKKAEDEAKNASLIAIAEKEKAQSVHEEIENARIDANFVQTNLPKTKAGHAARLTTRAFCQILEKFPKEKSYAKIQTYMAQAEISASETDNFAKSAHEKYKNLACKAATNQALVDAEAAELAVQGILISMSLSLRLFTQDLQAMYAIAYAIEKSVYAINKAHKSVENAELACVTNCDNKLYSSRACLDKTHADFESHVKSVGEALLRIVKEKFQES